MAKARKPKATAKAGSTAGSSSSAAEPPSTPQPSTPPPSAPDRVAATSQSGEDEKVFDRRNLDRTIIAIPLLAKMEYAETHPESEQVFDIIIDVNLEYSGGRTKARETLRQWINELTSSEGDRQGIDESKSKYSQQYLFGRLSVANVRKLIQANEKARQENRTPDDKPGKSALYKIWTDHKVRVFTNASISTVKADAARNAFGTTGKDIVWAVLDTGIDKSHPHFKAYKNLDLDDPLAHRDFTQASNDDAALARSACTDAKGHGTHVAGIIAGEYKKEGEKKIVATVQRRDENGKVQPESLEDIPLMSGMAPQCKLLSLKVLDDNGEGLASNMIAAIEYLQELNGNGRRLRVHGVNMSVGYGFEPEWFACGQSPLCVEVDRLVRSGVVVVVAAGNTGYGYNQSVALGPVAAGQDVTINDPGNAELAITVGSTHRDMPHVYGVSYFSSKGPTGDGRLKPDIVAPGEKIISCESGSKSAANAAASATAANAATAAAASTGAADAPKTEGAAKKDGVETAYYKEDSGTSMAAPHVSGVIAAFLSVRREFIGKPETVKDVFMSTATDLKRAVYFQGKGLVDLMRAIQSV